MIKGTHGFVVESFNLAWCLPAILSNFLGKVTAFSKANALCLDDKTHRRIHKLCGYPDLVCR